MTTPSLRNINDMPEAIPVWLGVALSLTTVKKRPLQPRAASPSRKEIMSRNHRFPASSSPPKALISFSITMTIIIIKKPFLRSPLRGTSLTQPQKIRPKTPPICTTPRASPARASG